MHLHPYFKTSTATSSPEQHTKWKQVFQEFPIKEFCSFFFKKFVSRMLACSWIIWSVMDMEYQRSTAGDRSRRKKTWSAIKLQEQKWTETIQIRKLFS